MMMTYNGKHHWVFPLIPTACAFAKRGGYFWEMEKAQIEVFQAQGDFLDHLEVRKVAESKIQMLRGKVENLNRVFLQCGTQFEILSREW